MKTCSKCRIPKEESEFNRSNTIKHGLQYWCRQCSKRRDRERNPENVARSRKNYEMNPEYPRIKRERWLKTTYGISLSDFDKLFNRQGGKCAICAEPMSRPFIDHCHETEKVRGLLCPGCNKGIGFLKDSPKVLISAARYLKMARYLK